MTGSAGVRVYVPLHPPDALAVASQAAKDASMAAWVWQADSFLSVGQLKVTAGAGVTVKVRVQVCVGAQELV